MTSTILPHRHNVIPFRPPLAFLVRQRLVGPTPRAVRAVRIARRAVRIARRAVRGRVNRRRVEQVHPIAARSTSHGGPNNCPPAINPGSLGCFGPGPAPEQVPSQRHGLPAPGEVRGRTGSRGERGRVDGELADPSSRHTYHLGALTVPRRSTAATPRRGQSIAVAVRITVRLPVVGGGSQRRGWPKAEERPSAPQGLRSRRAQQVGTDRVSALAAPYSSTEPWSPDLGKDTRQTAPREVVGIQG